MISLEGLLERCERESLRCRVEEAEMSMVSEGLERNVVCYQLLSESIDLSCRDI